MLSVSAGRGRVRPSGALIAVLGAAVLLMFYWLLRDDRSPSRRALDADAPTSDGVAVTTAGDEDERPAAPRARSQPPDGPKRHAASPADSEPPREATPAEAEGSAVRTVIAASLDHTQRGTDTLIAHLTHDDEVVVAEATRALVARGATEAIAPLARIDLTAAAGSGLSIIDALGKLAGVAEGAERSAAVDRLIAMLAEEKRRGARESPGNLIQIYEALGQTNEPRAAPPLEAELLDPRVPRAPKVVVVASLVLLAQDSSRGPLETALATERAAKGTDDFEEEIRVELVGAIEGALGLR